MVKLGADIGNMWKKGLEFRFDRQGVQMSKYVSNKSGQRARKLTELARMFGAALLDDFKPIAKPLSTGCLALDFLLEGGIPAGLITEIVGDFSTGKSMLGLQLCREAINAGGWGLLIDSENALNKPYAIKVLGVDKNLMTYMGEDLESTYDFVINLLKKEAKKGKIKDPAIIVWDTIAGTPPAEVKDTKQNTRFAPWARIHSEKLPVLLTDLRSTGIALVLMNQLRSKMNVLFGRHWESHGGRAINFYPSLRLHLTPKGKITVDNTIVGTKGRMEIIKSRVCRPFGQVDFTIDFEKGITPWSGTLELFKKAGLVKINGSMYELLAEDGSFCRFRPSQLNRPDIYEGLWEKADKEILKKALGMRLK